MGTVYLGEHTLLRRMAAIKVLLPSLSADAEIVDRFFNEARAVTLISDPGIVQIFDFGYDSDDRAFIIMELLEGESITRRLRRIARFHPAECLRLARLLAKSLAAAHDKRIVHRDLKPANIFIVSDSAVTGGERAKILDFGIAKQAGDGAGKLKTRTGVLMGTPMYMSPEQCRGVGDIDHRSDIYSLGCVMFTMLTGQPPFGRGGPGELVVAHLHQPPPLASSRVSGIPAIIDEILQRCLKKSPAERYQSMMEVAQAINAAEQSLTRPIASSVTAEPSRANNPAGSAPLPGGQIPILLPGHAVFPPASGGVDTIHPGPTTLNGASGQSFAPAPQPGPNRRRLAGFIMMAGLAGSLGAVALSRIERNDDASSSFTPGTNATAQARAPAQTAPADPALPMPTSPDPAIEDIGPAVPAAPDAGVLATLPAHTGDSATRRPERPRPGGKPVLQPEMKDHHEHTKGLKSHPSPTPPSGDSRGTDAQSVERGD
jgi:serine/threonine-protein kinase